MLARGQLADLASRLKPISKTDLPGDPPLDDPQVLRSARIIQLLEWSSDPKAAQQYRRLIGER
jgi:hypothetical protein